MAACGTLGRKSTSHARRKIIYWKLHKVGGSETCAIFSRYASERGLSFERDPDIRRNPKGRDHFDIICAHDVIRNPHWLELWANHPMTLHFVTFREPVSMAISRYYFQITHSEPSHPLYQYIPTIPEAREWFCVFLDRFLYTLEFAPRGYPGTPQLALQEHHLALALEGLGTAAVAALGGSDAKEAPPRSQPHTWNTSHVRHSQQARRTQDA